MAAQSSDLVTVNPLTEKPTTAWERIRLKTPCKVVKQEKLLHTEYPTPSNYLRFVCISDTHSKIERTKADFVPPGDVLLHGGDITLEGRPIAVKVFNDFLGSLPHKHKIVIAGNHDLIFDRPFMKAGRLRTFGMQEDIYFKQLEGYQVQNVRELLTNCTYIEDELIDLCGIKIYGSPWQPAFHGWAFNVKRGQNMLDKWNKIPDNTDILITHGPPVGFGDVTKGGNNVGCVELLATVQKRVKPKYHIFGHIHEGYGTFTDGSTTYINCCTCTLQYRATNPPIVFDYPIPEGHTKEETIKFLTSKVNETGDTEEKKDVVDEKKDGAFNIY